jgi:amino acid adenylation domain-containing protein
MTLHTDNSTMELSASERHKILVEWNNTQADYPKDKCIHQLFEEQVERTPNAIAVVFEDKQLTYEELNRRANQLAHHLQSLGVSPEVLVGICVERSVDMVVGLLAILKAGGAYVPLEPSYPKERLAFMMKDTSVGVALSKQSLKQTLSLETGARQVVCLDADQSRFEHYPASNPCVAVEAHHLAYVIYTSGSTGKPKGVMLAHEAVCNQMHWLQRTFPLNSRDRVLQKTPFSFDASVWEILLPLFSGAQLVMARPQAHKDVEYLIDAIASNQITTLQVVPSLLQLLCEAKGFSSLNSLKRIFSGGEALPTALVRRCLEQLKVELVNLYGPTEACIQVTSFTCDLHEKAAITPIGKPADNTQIYVLDKDLETVPIGEVGELHIGGNQLARGYLNQPELTTEKFIENPFGPGRLYASGDLARYRTDGVIEFVGRVDHQVKLRGFRIELGEVEGVLSLYKTIREAVVLVREDKPGQKYMVAYMTAKEGQELDVDSVRTFLKNHLPDYMIPNAWSVLESFPLTPNGKIDRAALPAPVSKRDGLSAAYVAPQTADEHRLAEIWKELLNLKEIGVHDNFFELGGHSLLATQMIARIQPVFGVKLKLQKVFAQATIAELMVAIEKIKHEGESVEELPLRRFKRPDALPLSFAQQRLWFITHLEESELNYEGAHSTYNIPVVLRLIGVLDVACLQRALNTLIERHESLRTFFPIVKGKPRQAIAPHGECVLSAEPLAPEEMDATIADFWQKPFDLNKGPLQRLALFQIGTEEHLLLWPQHHIISDAWSLGILMQECKQLYQAFIAGEPSPLKPLALQYADYTLWQRLWLTNEILADEMDYWQQQLAGMPTVLEFPTDRVRPAVSSFQGKSYIHVLPSELVKGLKQLAQEHACTLFMTLLAGFDALLYRYSGQEDFCVGSPVAHRRHKETESMVGFFVNTLVLRATVQGNKSFAELLSQVRQVCLGAYEHQDVPFEALVERLHLERSLSYHPLFQVMFILQNTQFDFDKDQYDWGKVQVQEQTVSVPTAKFDLILEIFDTGDSKDDLRCYWEYSSDLFDEETLKRITKHFEQILRAAVNNPEEKVAALPLLTAQEHHQLLKGWNATDKEWSEDGYLHEWFEAQARQTPDAAALIYGNESLTYGELNARANQLAHYLILQGVGPDQLVAICLERSLQMIIGLLAILKAGGVYLPLDVDYPKERVVLMLHDAGVKVVLTESKLWRSLNIKGEDFLVIDFFGKLDLNHLSVQSPTSKVRAHHLIYVLYTSGSTGQPKGVAMEHRAVSNLIHWQNEMSHPQKSHNRTLQFSPISFDVSFQEIFSTLTTGGTLVLINQEVRMDPEQLLASLMEHRISRLFLPYVALKQLVRVMQASQQLSLPYLREIITAGETLRIDNAFRSVFTQLPDVSLWNQYGPTETHVVTAYQLQASRALNWPTLPSIGRPIANVQIFLLDGEGQPVPIGVSGELYCGGVCLARGYLNRSELTAEKFISNPFGKGRLYKTGDLARYLPNGDIEFIGRSDQQVKIRGFRIELGEVEAALNSHPSIKEAAVLVHEEKGNKSLIAYLISRDSGEPKISDLRKHLKEQLPDYMIPSAWVNLDTLPLTPSGKLNRRALPLPEHGISGSSCEYAAPRTQLEKTLVSIWQEILNIERVGIHDNFFKIGGHSLLVMKIIHRIRQSTQQKLPLSVLFQAPTVAELARLLKQPSSKFSSNLIVPIITKGKRPPFYLIHPGGGTVFCYHRLARLLQTDQPIYGIRAFGTEPGDPPAIASVIEMAQIYRQAIRQQQPSGPYALGGWSLGGTIAFEMARQWQDEGETIFLLALLDSFSSIRPQWQHWLTTLAPRVSTDMGHFSWHNLMEYFHYRLSIPRNKLPSYDHPQRWAELLTLDTDHQLLPADTSEEDEERLWAAFVAGTTAAVEYQPKDYSGVVNLFQATVGFEEARPHFNGWEGYAEQVICHCIEGNHFDFVEGHPTAQLAKALQILMLKGTSRK